MDELILGDSLELLIDNRGKNPPFSPLGVPVVSGMSVREGRLDLTAANTASIDTWRQWMPRPTKPHDVVLTSEAPLGRVALVRTDEPIVIGQRVFCMRGRKGTLDSRFLYYALQTDQVQADLASRATGPLCSEFVSRSCARLGFLRRRFVNSRQSESCWAHSMTRLSRTSALSMQQKD